MDDKLTFRRFSDGEHNYTRWSDDIFNEDTSYKCPTYVHKTPPCQGSCPSGEDIRGWLQIVRGIEKPPADVSWQEYAFRRSTDANPFPSMMGRVCPAPCQEGCNRNEVEDFVGINSVEQYIGDHALQEGLASPSSTSVPSSAVCPATASPATACRATSWTARTSASSTWA
jgi:glutamate synthase (NADPH/NADH) small chain